MSKPQATPKAASLIYDNKLPIFLLIIELPPYQLQPIHRQGPERHIARKGEHIHPIIAPKDYTLTLIDAVLIDPGLFAFLIKQLFDV